MTDQEMVIVTDRLAHLAARVKFFENLGDYENAGLLDESARQLCEALDDETAEIWVLEAN